MNKYEILYIMDAKLDEAVKEAQVEKYSALVTLSGGEVESVNKWGVKRLAYPIGFRTEGYYVLMNFTANPDLPLEIARQMKISDEIMRQLIIRKD